MYPSARARLSIMMVIAGLLVMIPVFAGLTDTGPEAYRFMRQWRDPQEWRMIKDDLSIPLKRLTERQQGTIEKFFRSPCALTSAMLLIMIWPPVAAAGLAAFYRFANVQ